MLPDRLSAALTDRYRIERELGAGGMATVFLAEDLKHKRKVALKVLKPELAAVLGAERFVQEITTTASLSHPHILPLFDSGTADGFLFYVMPYVEGETLRDKLNRETQLGVDEAVRIAVEVADALHYAHSHGVIHRDIKPENILMQNGRPMVADFGIALAVSAAAGGRMTETGLSLGTPHYMSPEQATAEKEITARSDVYSLASVLYEMLTGTPPHVGASAQQIIMKIVTDAARPVTELRKTVPTHVAAALAQALEKLPADRFASASDFAASLEGRFATRSLAHGASVATHGAPWRRVAAGAGFVAVASLALAAWALQRTPDRQVTRVSIAFPESERLQATATRVVTISPDGSRLIYVGPASSGSQLWVREMNSLVARALPGTSEALAPFFSPDGESVGFFTGVPGDLKTVSVRAGAPVIVVRDSANPWGGDWGEDGNIYFNHATARLARVPANGGRIEIVSVLDTARGETEHDWPQLLPGGRAVLVQAWHGSIGDAELGVLDLSTQRVTPVITAAYGRYLRSGHLLYADADGALAVVPFDPGDARTGPPIALSETVAIDNNSGSAQFDVSRTGTIIYQPGGGEGGQQVSWVDRTGRAVPVDSAWRGNFRTVALSPDGTRIAVTLISADGEQVWIKQLPTGPLTRLTFGGANTRPRWMPDGRRVAFVSTRGARRGAWVQRADGSAEAESLLVDPRQINEVLPTPDGRDFILRMVTGWDLFRLRPGADSALAPLLVGPHQASGADLSPDGRWLAYTGNESGRSEIYVRRFDDPGAGRSQVSIDGGEEPRWSHTGREIFFRSGRGEVLVSEVSAGASFSARSPKLLFRMPSAARDQNHRAYDLSLDDRRLLMIMGRASQNGELVLVTNWFTELKARSRGVQP